MSTATALDPKDADLLSFLHAMNGHATKSRIRHAWETGDYSDIRGITENGECTLQHLRNTLGPSWLNGLKWKSLR